LQFAQTNPWIEKNNDAAALLYSNIIVDTLFAREPFGEQVAAIW